jgi:hypothetical protein
MLKQIRYLLFVPTLLYGCASEPVSPDVVSHQAHIFRSCSSTNSPPVLANSPVQLIKVDGRYVFNVNQYVKPGGHIIDMTSCNLNNIGNCRSTLYLLNVEEGKTYIPSCNLQNFYIKVYNSVSKELEETRIMGNYYQGPG